MNLNRMVDDLLRGRGVGDPPRLPDEGPFNINSELDAIRQKEREKNG